MKILITYTVILVFAIVKIESSENNAFSKDNSKTKHNIFEIYTQPKTPQIFYDYFKQKKYFSIEYKDSLDFFPNPGSLIFNVYLYYNYTTDELRYKIYKVNYDEFNFDLKLKVNPRDVWTECEKSIIKEIKNWKVNRLYKLKYSIYLLNIEFIYNDEKSIHDLMYIPLH